MNGVNIDLCKGCKYWLHVNGEIIGYKWVYAIWMLIEVLVLELKAY